MMKRGSRRVVHVLFFFVFFVMARPCGGRLIRSRISGPVKLGWKLSELQTEDYVKGSIWPKPQEQSPSNLLYTLTPTEFNFSVDGQASDVLKHAFARYIQLTFPDLVVQKRRNLEQIYKLAVDVISDYEPLSLGTDESYKLAVVAPTSVLTAQTVWGALRGLETFSQIVHQDVDGLYVARGTTIIDYPRFQHRGFMIDTSRHFLPVPVIQKFLDAMSYSKFNVLHWHIVDDQSFPFVSETFPELSNTGARNNKTHVYNKDDIAKILEHARLRGIRVIPEFDTPGHTFSWRGIRDLLTPCYDAKNTRDSKEVPNGQYGPINPILDSTYKFLEALFAEIAGTFPDRYIHLGGDEVQLRCWLSNPDILRWMENMGYQKNLTLLEQYYEKRLLKIVDNQHKESIIWQEVFDNNVEVFPNTVINVWKGSWQFEMAQVTGKGLKAILSSCWYLNYISYAKDWWKYYQCDPTHFLGSAMQKELVMGGTGCMWGEWVDATNVLTRTWPRAMPIGERLWSSETTTNITDADERLWEHRCRYLRRGIPAQNGVESKYCRHEWLNE